MPRYTLSFRVDPADGTTEQAFRRDLYRRFGLKLFSVAWAEIDLLDWPRLDEFLATTDDLERQGVARLGSGILVESLPPDEAERCDWFLLRSEPFTEFELEPYPSIRADRVPPGRHILHDGRFVSERFKAVSESAALSGIDFLWADDRGKHRAPQWHVPIATACIGRGVDHPWSARTGAAQGVWRFDARALRPGWTTGRAAADRLLAKFPTDSSLGLRIHTLRRFAREELPAADFAYNWDPAAEPFGRPRFRTLCVSARAKRVLVDAGVLSARDMAPALAITGARGGEAPGGYPPPMFTGDELASLRDEERRRWTAHERRERPERRPTLARSLKLLRDAKRSRAGDFSKGAPASRIERAEAALGARLPADWAEVLAIADGGQLGHGENDCEIVSLDALPAFHRERIENGRATDDDYPERYLNVATNASGDYVALDLDADRAAREGAVAWFDHETLQIARRWDSVAAFLESVLAG